MRTKYKIWSLCGVALYLLSDVITAPAEFQDYRTAYALFSENICFAGGAAAYPLYYCESDAAAVIIAGIMRPVIQRKEIVLVARSESNSLVGEIIRLPVPGGHAANGDLRPAVLL